MSGATRIEWATHVWNPVTGCTKVSQGCKHCYAERIAGRFYGSQVVVNKTAGMGLSELAAADARTRRFSDVICHPERLDEPLHWRKPRRIFVCSMSDLFHEAVPDNFIDSVFDAMNRQATQHTYMVLTKRPGRMLRYFQGIQAELPRGHKILPRGGVWLGVSVEDQATADERIPLLLQTPAAVRFVSYEPALGPVDFTAVAVGNGDAFCPMSHNEAGDELCHPGLDWVICGGESGPGARPMHPDWARSTRDQCKAACVPFFFKQWGEWAPSTDVDIDHPLMLAKIDGNARIHKMLPGAGAAAMLRVGKKRAGRLLDGREHNEWPEAK